MRGELEAALGAAGIEAEGAADGTAALRFVHAIQPDAVLLGLDLPGLDGWEVLRRLRALSEAPVLILAERESEVCKVRALRAGADGYLAKPFDAATVLSRLEAMLRRDTAGAPELFYP